MSGLRSELYYAKAHQSQNHRHLFLVRVDSQVDRERYKIRSSKEVPLGFASVNVASDGQNDSVVTTD